MSTESQHHHVPFAVSPRRRVAASLLMLTAFVGVIAAATLCAAGRYSEAAAAAAAMIALAFIFAARVSIESILTVWFAATPLASYFIRFPVDKSIVTFDRAAIALAVIVLLLKIKRTDAEARSCTAISKFEIAWALLSVIALASALVQSNDVTYASRIAIDSFWLPLAAFHLARYHFDARGRAGLIIISAIAVGLFLFATGAYELATGANLFPYKGSELVREGELRVNGPFAADASYSIICLLLAVFLIAAPRAFNARLDRAAQFVLRTAIAAAIAASLFPLFRAVAAALIFCLIVLRIAASRDAQTRRRIDATTNESTDSVIDSPFSHTNSAVAASARLRVSRSLLAIILLAAAIGFIMFGPYSLERRLTDPRNAYGRLATWEAAAEMALEHPLAGVGLANYHDYFHAKYNWHTEAFEAVMFTRAADSPHSNFLWIAADLGLIALALYIAAYLFLFKMGYAALRKAASEQQRPAAACFIALVVAYLIPGLTLASGYYSDLNLYFFFMLGLLSNKFLVSGS
ncbi:MAG TPA: O-antigen ligase family protein [Blastocatellia bacterium]|nr:O-antigen ligase family protein [Blastocatellia bacterium]